MPRGKRQAGFIGLIVGGRGTGKSTYINNSIIGKSKKKTLIFDTDENLVYAHIPLIHIEELDKLATWESGIYRIIDIDYEYVFQKLNAYVSDALLIIEDATKYISNRAKADIKKLVLGSKQRRIDMLFTFHSFRSIPPDLCGYSDMVEIFKTGESLREFKHKIPIHLVLPTFEKVNAHRSRFYHKTAPMR